MTQLFLNPLTKFTSDNITSLPGARLYFYENNSSTPKAVYADKSKVTSLGVYVEADSAGIFEPIWLDGTYRATLKYSTNWTSDPVGVVQTGWPIDDVGDIGNFAAFAAWDSTFTYDITTNTFVTGADGKYYKSIQNPNLNKNPVSNPDYWEQIRFQAVWNATRAYVENDIVEWEGKLYSSKDIVNINHEPPNLTYWNDLTFNNVIAGDLDVTGSLTVDVNADIAGSLTADDINSSTIELANANDVDPNKLDWYEEISFTPTVTGVSSSGTCSYLQQSGQATRIGNILFYRITIGWTGHTGTGLMRVGLLPYSGAGSVYAAVVSYSGLAAGAGLQVVGEAVGQYVFFNACDPAGGSDVGIDIDSSCTLHISGQLFCS